MTVFKRRHFSSVAAILLALCIVFSVLTVPVYADTIHILEDTKYLGSSRFESSVDSDGLKDYIRAQVQNLPGSISIYSFGVPDTEASALATLIFDDIPETFHVNGISYSIRNGRVKDLYLTYACTKSQYDVMLGECYDVASEILEGIKGNSALDDVQKALLVHDRLAVLCEYDSKNLATGIIPDESFNMYGALSKRVAVCQGYAEAYVYILRMIGIDSYLCESDTLNHAWNIVEINGKEYHVDVTWDDPTNDITGQVQHKNFLLSSDGIYNSGHTAYDYNTSPSDTTFDNYFWSDSTTEFQLIDNEIYYIDMPAAQIKKYSDKTAIHSVESVWSAGAGYYWTENYARLSSDGVNLLFSKADGVYAYNIAADSETLVWTPDLSVGAYFSIFGFALMDGYLVCDIYNSPSFGLTTKETYQQRKLYDAPVTPPPAAYLVSAQIETAPYKTMYYTGDALDTSGLSLILTYSDASTAIITDGFAVSGYDSSSAGYKTITVSYGGKSATFTVLVKTPSITLGTDNLALNIGETYTVSVATDPAGQPVSVTQTGSAVTVNNLGVITGVADGESDITFSFVYNGNKYSAQCHVSVGCEHINVTEYDFVESTCITHGHGAYTVCNDCGGIIEGSATQLPYAPHNYVEIADESCIASAATCQVPASYYKSCDFCNNISDEIFYSGETAAHTPETVYGKAPTCAETGLTDGEKCAVCGIIITQQETIPLGDHDYVSQVIASDCVNAGYTIHTCSVCGNTYNSDPMPLAAHTTDNGECYVCSSYIVEAGHTVLLSFSSATELSDVAWQMKDDTSAVIASTCVNIYETDRGTIYEYVAEVEGVGEGETEIYVIISGLNLAKEKIIVLPHSNHVAVTIEGYAPTCENVGFTDGEKCSYCDEIIVPQQEIPATGHILGDWETEVPAGANGVAVLCRKCVFCGEILDRKTEGGTTEKPEETTTEPATKPDETTTKPDESTTETTTEPTTKPDDTTLAPDIADVLVGDTNGDGKVTAMDARLALRIAAKLDEPTDVQFMASDANGDGKVTAMDARLILRKAAKLD